MESKGLTFDNLINELKNNNAQTVKGSYTFKELTHKQQRKILSGNFDAVEIPAKLSNIYSDYTRMMTLLSFRELLHLKLNHILLMF